MIDLESLKEYTCDRKDCLNLKCKALRIVIPQIEKLLDLARKMREAQRNCYRDRNMDKRSVIDMCKLEAELDELLR